MDTPRTNALPLRRRPALLGGSPSFTSPVYITRPMLPDEQVFGQLMHTVLHSRWFTNDGPVLKEFERRLRTHLSAGFCAVFCNGTVALQVALRSLDLTGEVITTPFTFPATVHAIEWNGLTPVFCDINPNTYNLDPAAAALLVTERTSALLPVHIFGNPCDVVAIQQLAESKHLRTVYDAAHAFAVSYHGQPISYWGDLSVLSFHATKLFHTCEGGAVVGQDLGRLRPIALLRNFGIVNEDEVRGVGLNGKMSELHAAMGLALLDLVDHEISARGQLVAAYEESLSGIAGLTFQSAFRDTTRNHAYFTMEVDEEEFGISRDELHAALRAENIITRRYFYPLCSQNVSYRHLPSAQADRLPNAHRVASRILCLPLFGELTAQEVHRIVESILDIRANAGDIRHCLGGSRA